MAEIDLTGHDWTTWAKDQRTIYDSSSNYGSRYPWKALNGLLTADYHCLLSGTAVYWCIDFGPYNQVEVTTVSLQANTWPEPNRMPKDFTIQGSNNNSSWDTLYTATGETSWGDEEKRDYTLTSPDTYQYYKIDITDNNGDASYTQIGELYLLGSSSDPTGMEESSVVGHSWSGSTNGDMTASASSTYGGRNPWEALEGSPLVYQDWLSGSSSCPHWWKIDLGDGNPETFTSIGIQVNLYPEPTRAPKDFIIYGSNNDSDWDTLKTVTGESSWLRGECRRFDLTATGSYRYYKIAISDVNGGGYAQIAELYFYESTASGWTGKICGVTNPAKINGIAVADIAKVCGV